MQDAICEINSNLADITSLLNITYNTTYIDAIDVHVFKINKIIIVAGGIRTKSITTPSGTPLIYGLPKSLFQTAFVAMSYDGSYARGRNARRDSMGRYSRDAGSYGDGSYARGSYEQGYSREAKEDLEMELRQMKAKNPEASHMIDMWMDQLSRN